MIDGQNGERPRDDIHLAGDEQDLACGVIYESTLAGGQKDSDNAPIASGLNDWQRTGYGGPCPPIGRHRYFFKLYALDARLALRGRPTKADVERAMRGHVLAEAVLMGTYRR
jgi:Raf kinase inhibitor-like YbhB/YbcL family protein